MRTWLYNRIKAIGGFPAGMGTRVSSAGAAENPIKPFMRVAMGVEQPPLGASPEERTQNIPFTVYCHDAPGSFLNIDDAAKLLKENLPTEDGAVVGNMSVYRIKWEETGEDGFDDHFGTIVRPVRFSMMTRRAG